MPRKSFKKVSKKSGELKPAKVFLNFIAWVTGIVVSLSIGFAMIGGTLTVPYWLGGSVTSMIAGWIVVIATFAGVVTAIFSR